MRKSAATPSIRIRVWSRLSWALLLLAPLLLWAGEAPRPSYQDPAWKPRAVLPAADILRGDFWPASPPVTVDYDDPGFAAERLGGVPAPGVHPRVLMTPADVERIRAKVALGDRAPAPFRVMWERVAKSKSAFYALVMQDEVLGRTLAAELAAKVATLEPKLDALDRRPDRDNLWAVERSITASGDPDPPKEIWELPDYDYLHRWMSAEQREAARRVIARLTAGRTSNFMAVPDHFMINNHQGFGLEFVRLQLLIEGEEGFDPRVFAMTARKARAMLDWYLDADGMCFESIKGWLNISAFTAIGLRQRDLLRHGHLRAKMRFFQAALRWEDGAWRIRDEMRASAFHVIWMMHWFHPQDRAIDLLYRATFTTHDFLTDAKARWPNPVGIVPELLALYADDGITGADGRPQDWTDQQRIDGLKLPTTWKDDQRGYLIARNSWGKDDLQVGFTCKQDFFYGGHEGSENNRLALWGGGVNWIQDLNMLATKQTFLQNMVTIDGKGLRWPPAPGVWLGVVESPLGVSAAGDGRIGYSFSKRMQVHPLDFPSARLPYYAPFAEGNFDLTRDLQVAFHPNTVRWNDGYAHTDYGPWSGETRLVEHYQEWNPMRRAYRTVHLARGGRPYVLVLDDLQKDDAAHLFEWNISLPPDSDLVEAQAPEINFQAVEPTDRREAGFLLGTRATARDPKTGRLVPKKGDPLCLVKVLWRNAPYGFPVPRFERFRGHNGGEFQGFAGFAHLTIPSLAVSPEFRVLIYPHRCGDPQPVTSWNQDRSELTVQIGTQTDRYRFATGDGGRTVFAATRDGAGTLSSAQPPPRPVINMHGRLHDPADRRDTRDDGQPFVFHFGGRTAATLVRPVPPAVIRYTLDGSDPTGSSPVYEAPVAITTSCSMKARVYDPRWTCGPTEGAVTTARFIRDEPLAGLAEAPAGSRPGLLARVYEKKTVMWDDHGFFRAGLVMMPDVDRLEPMHRSAVEAFTLPHVVPQRPVIEQCKGFYRWTGWFLAAEPGLYGFSVDSCGPVTLMCGGRTVIGQVGVFHQQQAVRRGEVVLDRGWHAIDLVVCDPLFWNLTTTQEMPVAVTVQAGAGAPQAITAAMLRFMPDGALAAAPETLWHEAVQDAPRLEPGVELALFDRTGRRRDADYLDLEGLVPVRSGPADAIEANVSTGMVRCYTGWFRAPVDGIYVFDLPARRAESAGLGELQAAYQNQLRVGDEVVVQRGVPGRCPTRHAGLKAGWHVLSIRLGSSLAPGTVTHPDGQTMCLSAALLCRPVLVSILPQGAATVRRAVEIYGPTTVTLALPGGAAATIRYTRDGRVPDAGSPLYDGPLAIDATTTITACAFENGRAVTAPARTVLTRVGVPTADLLGHVDFRAWKGPGSVLETGPDLTVWIDPTAILVDGRQGRALAVNRAARDGDGRPGPDANLTHGSGRPGFKLVGLRMKENALAIAIRFASATADGRLFGKDGYSAFGKSYKTVSCSLARGRLQAGPGRLGGGTIASDTWHQVVLTGDENGLALYLDGACIANGPGSRDLATDALDCFTDHAALVEEVRVWNRVLAPDDVRQLFQADAAPR